MPRAIVIAAADFESQSVTAVAAADYTVRLLNYSTGESLSPPLRESGTQDKQVGYGVCNATQRTISDRSRLNWRPDHLESRRPGRV